MPGRSMMRRRLTHGGVVNHATITPIGRPCVARPAACRSWCRRLLRASPAGDAGIVAPGHAPTGPGEFRSAECWRLRRWRAHFAISAPASPLTVEPDGKFDVVRRETNGADGLALTRIDRSAASSTRPTPMHQPSRATAPRPSWRRPSRPRRRGRDLCPASFSLGRGSRHRRTCRSARLRHLRGDRRPRRAGARHRAWCG